MKNKPQKFDPNDWWCGGCKYQDEELYAEKGATAFPDTCLAPEKEMLKCLCTNE